MVTMLLAPCRNFSKRQTDSKVFKYAPLRPDPRVHESTCIHPVIKDGKVVECGEKCRRGKHGWHCEKHYWLSRPRIRG